MLAVVDRHMVLVDLRVQRTDTVVCEPIQDQISVLYQHFQYITGRGKVIIDYIICLHFEYIYNHHREELYIE